MSVDAIMGTFVSIKTMADGTPRIILDLQCGLADVAAMGLIPGVPFAIARLNKESAAAPVPVAQQPDAPKEKPGQLCVMAVNFCKDPKFREWIDWSSGVDCFSEEDAKQFILNLCEIESRKELDTNPRAAADFHNMIRKRFIAWRDEQ